MDINKKGILLVVSGPSGSGKGTVLSHILEDREHYALSVSLTTRAPRQGEKNGVNYYFVTEKEFFENVNANNMLEYASFCDNFYGTPANKVNELLEQGINVILEIETKGAMQVKKACPDAVLVMILPPSYATLSFRLHNRNTETERTIQKRLNEAKKELKKLHKYDYCVINYDFESEKAAEDIRNIVEAERRKTARNPAILDAFYSEKF